MTLSFHSSRLLTSMILKHKFKSETMEASKSENRAILNVGTICAPDVPRKAAVTRHIVRYLVQYRFHYLGIPPSSERYMDITGIESFAPIPPPINDPWQKSKAAILLAERHAGMALGLMKPGASLEIRFLRQMVLSG
ncbi:hypothetical protein CEXT_326091 [Caerostris extrusa]|uniref:Uncharacterized protein n=1 Tax=Caerostris extrusa TaxID=172846 RepID=A0AAV4X513_CAEEX|nr:hypothetical protein CEXT_326091 [Caerostris extrusa]